MLDQALLYIFIYFLSIPFMLVYNFGSAVLRSYGDSRRPMYYLLISGTVNVILNLFLVIALQLGVAGVAIATRYLQCAERRHGAHPPCTPE